MALPTGVPEGRSSSSTWGIAVACDPPPNLDWSLEVWRAPDDGLGAPNTLLDEIAGRGVPGDSVFVDERASDGARWHYRARWTQTGYDPGEWTDWVSAIPVRLPRVPRDRARTDFDIELIVKPGGVVDVLVDATPVARSVKIAYTVDAAQPFPGIGTGQAFELDAGGEALIEDITDDVTYPDAEVPPDAGQLVRGTIKCRATFYDRAGGEGNVLKTLRAVESLDQAPVFGAGLHLRGDTVWLSYQGNVYTSAIRWATSKSALPAPASVDPGAGTIEVGQESEGFALSPTLDTLETLFVRARAYTSELAENSDLQSDVDHGVSVIMNGVKGSAENPVFDT